MRLTARIPATVANLGPGFDSFGLALSLFNEIEIDTDAARIFEIEGEGADELPRDESNLVMRAMRSAAEMLDGQLPGCSLRCVNRIPLERGLGSSAAAVVGGTLLAARLLKRSVEPQSLLPLAASIEGHADNVAAALFGGVSIAYEERTSWRAERIDPTPDLRPLVLIPETERIRTEDARRVLPDKVGRIDATFNAARTALLVLALTERPHLLPLALDDRTHQEARLKLAPQAETLFRRLKEAGVPVCVAGSGPTLLAFESEGWTVPDPGDTWRILRLPVAGEGASVLERGHDGR